MLSTPRSRRGMVTSPHHLASQAGLGVLQEGGNAVEAAVAAAAVLGVVYPHMTGLGGDGFWLIAAPGAAPVTIEGCGGAGARTTRAFYAGLSAIPSRGAPAANSVAGAVSSWAAALSHAGGALPRARLLRDAILYAGEGAPASASLAAAARLKQAELTPVAGFAEAFAPGGGAIAEGALLTQPRLARTLERLAADGFDGFYRGALAQDLAADLADLGAPVGLEDLAGHAARTTAPLTVPIAGARLFNTPPPTQGLASLLMLALFDRLSPGPAEGFGHVHGLVEAAKAAFRIRDREIADPAAMRLDPQALLDDHDDLDEMAAALNPRRAAPWGPGIGPGGTVWLGAVDGEGLAVSLIQSVYFEFGSGLVLPRTGVIWQNRGCSFSLDPAARNALRPGAKPFHTLNPALARFADGRVMVYGAMGGEGQPQFQAALFTRYAQYGQGLQQAVTAPRWLLGRTWGEPSIALRLENRFDPALAAALAEAGHPVELAPAFSDLMGHAGAIVRRADGVLEGASDPRSDGAVACW